MNCPYCGQPNEANAAFCGNCGRPLTATANVNTGFQTVQAAAPSFQATAPEISATPNPAPSPSPTPMPAYPNAPVPPVPATSHPGENKAMASVVLGAIGIPAALIPIAGLICGITGLVLGTMARSRAKHKMSLVGIALSCLAIALSVGAWVYNIEHASSLHKSNSGSTTTSFNTTCYNAKVDSKLNIGSQIDCNIEAYDGSSPEQSSEVYDISAASSPSLTPSNLASTVKSEVPSITQTFSAAGENFTVSSQHSGTFAQAPAYYIDLSASDASMEIVAVYHKASNGDNAFVFTHIINSSGANTTYLADNFQWK